MISQTAEYALRAVVALAANDGESLTAKALAEQTRVPAGYLAKIMQGLSRAGLVMSRRGLHGGFTLARPPEKLSIHDVIDAVDPVRRFKSCPLELPWHCDELCKLHRSLDEMFADFIKQSKATPIAELLPPAAPRAVKPKRRRAAKTRRRR